MHNSYISSENKFAENKDEKLPFHFIHVIHFTYAMPIRCMIEVMENIFKCNSCQYNWYEQEG